MKVIGWFARISRRDPLDAGDREAGADRTSTRRRIGIVPLVGWVVAVGIVGLFLPSFVSTYTLVVAVDGATLALLALPIGFLAYRSGLVSLGHTAFFGASAYMVAIATTELEWSLPLAAIAALAVGFALSVLIGALAVRVTGMPFVMLTLAFGQVFFQLVQQQSVRSVTGGQDGLPVTANSTLGGLELGELGDPATFWPIVWIALILSILMFAVIGRSRFATLLEAVRENEERARFSGYWTYLPRLAVFALTGFVASLGGTLMALNQAYVAPEVFSFLQAGNALIAAIVGGLSFVVGPVVGGFVFIVARDRFAESGNLTLLTGMALIAVLVFVPGGIVGVVARGWKAAVARLRPEGSE